MIRGAQYRHDTKTIVIKPRPPGGRKRLIPPEKRAILYGLMKSQREAEKEITAILDSCHTDGQSYGRNRTALLLRVWREKGK